MANTILVNPDTLKEQSNQIRQYKEQHQEMMTKMTNLVLTIGEVWQGEAQAAFIAKYQSMQPVYDSFNEALDEFAELMQKVADEMQNADRSGQQIISAIN